MEKSRSRNSIKKNTSLEVLIKHIIATNRRGLMKLIYESGFDPYHKGEERIETYMLRNGIAIAHEDGEQGIKRLLSAHPEKDIILDLFATPGTFEKSETMAFSEAEMSNFLGDYKDVTKLPILGQLLPSTTEKAKSSGLTLLVLALCILGIVLINEQ